jgi:hypothetical protein
MQMRLRKSSRPVTQAPNNVSRYCIALVRNKVISERDLPPNMGHCISLRNHAVYPQRLMVISESLVRPRAIIKSFWGEVRFIVVGSTLGTIRWRKLTSKLSTQVDRLDPARRLG